MDFKNSLNFYDDIKEDCIKLKEQKKYKKNLD